MARYDDRYYIDTLTALIGDIYYAEGISYDAKIARMRKLAEVIVRRLLRHNTNSRLTLDDHRTLQALNDKGMTEPFFRDALTAINRKGRTSMHSQETTLPEQDEFDTVSEAMTHLYAYLFFDYFKHYELGSNDSVTSAFSTLPPYIRFVVFEELLKEGHVSVVAIDKLCKAAAKSLGVDDALKWTEDNRSWLESIDIPFDSDDAKNALEGYSALGDQGIRLFAKLLHRMSGTAYDYLMRELPGLESLASIPDQFKYSTFEEARNVYMNRGIVDGETEDVNAFNSLMKFVFEGRKSEESRELEQYANELLGSMEDLCSCCESMQRDAEIGEHILSILKETKTRIDEGFQTLLLTESSK